MSRIPQTFESLRKKGEKALVVFVTAGDPDLDYTAELVPQLERGGADIVELGIPFSDPMADGPTIQLASERALASGTTLPKILSTVKRIRESSAVPIVLMGYYNPILAYGLSRFAADASAAGVDGILIVDLPPEEGEELLREADGTGLDVISLLTPTSDDSRIGCVSRVGRGFIYYVSVTGVTGARDTFGTGVGDAVARIRNKVDLPVVVGFGISNPRQAAAAAESSDGIVVGSAVVKLFERFSGDELTGEVTRFVSSLKGGLAGVS